MFNSTVHLQDCHSQTLSCSLTDSFHLSHFCHSRLHFLTILPILQLHMETSRLHMWGTHQYLSSSLSQPRSAWSRASTKIPTLPHERSMMVLVKLKCLPWNSTVLDGPLLWWLASTISWRIQRLAWVHQHSMYHICSLFSVDLQFQSLMVTMPVTQLTPPI